MSNTWKHLGFQESNEEQLAAWDVEDGDLVHMQNTLQVRQMLMMAAVGPAVGVAVVQWARQTIHAVLWAAIWQSAAVCTRWMLALYTSKKPACIAMICCACSVDGSLCKQPLNNFAHCQAPCP